MTDTTKTEALRLAEHLENFRSFPDDLAAAAELRRLSAERVRLAAECEALRADAKRYRWLRNEAWGGNNKTGPYLVEFKPGLMPSAVTLLAEDAADAAITAAMGGKESQGGTA